MERFNLGRYLLTLIEINVPLNVVVDVNLNKIDNNNNNDNKLCWDQ